MRPLLELQGVAAGYAKQTLGHRLTGRSQADVIRDIDLEIAPAEVLALVGESGSGKSTLGRVILGLLAPRCGRVRFDGARMEADMAAYRWNVQVIFQDSTTTLHPAKAILWILTEPLRVHRIGTAETQARDAMDMLERVGLDPGLAGLYPAQLSGGQRQRVNIARALMLKPRLIVADEPVSALDISVQAQILNLLNDIQTERRLSLLFITHDMDVVRSIADRVAVMKDGRIVEAGERRQVFERRAHAYTRTLLTSSEMSCL